MVNEAKGDVAKFEKVLVEYRKAPNITKKRLYLETMEELLGRFQSVTIVDPAVKGLLPVFAGSNFASTNKKSGPRASMKQEVPDRRRGQSLSNNEQANLTEQR